MLTRRRVGSALLGAFSVLGGAKLSAFAQSIPDNRADQIKAAGKTMAFAAPGGDLGRILKAILADFTADTGIRVNYLEGPLLDIYGRMKAERTRPSIDVYVASSVTEAKGIQEGMYTPLDPKIVTNLSKVSELGRSPNGMGARMGFTNLGILYNRKLFEANNVPPPRRWEDIWAPALAGHPILGDTTSFYTVLYIAYLTKQLGGNESDPQLGINYLADRKSKLLAVVRTYPERMQMLNSGQAWLTVDVGMTSLPETRKNADLAFVTPEDGSPLFWNAYTAVKGSPNPIGAQLLINYLISDEIQARLARESFLGPISNSVKLDEELTKSIPYGERLARMTPLDNGAIGDAITKYRDLWNTKMTQ